MGRTGAKAWYTRKDVTVVGYPSRVWRCKGGQKREVKSRIRLWEQRGYDQKAERYREGAQTAHLTTLGEETSQQRKSVSKGGSKTMRSESRVRISRIASIVAQSERRSIINQHEATSRH
jgi:hypothetical protein